MAKDQEGTGGAGFSDAEKSAMKERAAELRAARKGAKADPLGDLLARIAELPEPDRSVLTRLHEVITAAAPELAPRTWYGMPAYTKGGKVVCFVQAGAKFGSRYATLGFNDAAALDDGDMWPTAYAIPALSGQVEAEVARLVRRAAGSK